MKIKDIGKIITGKTPSTKDSSFWSGNVPFITPKDLQRGKHVFITDRTITKKGAESVAGCLIPKNSICVSCIGNLGYVSMTTKDSCTNQQINSIIPSKEFDSDFVYYLIKSLWSFFKHYEGQSTTVSILNKSQFSEIDIPNVPLNIQKKIASFLSTIDEKIECNETINDNLSKQCSALYLASVSNASSAKLEELIEQVESGARPKGGAEQSGVPSIGAEKIEYFGTYDFSSEKYISEEFFNKMRRGKVHNGDVLLYKDGAYTGKVSLALDGYPHEKCAANEHVFLLRTKDLSAQFFLYFTLSSPSIMDKVHTLSCAKAAQPGLNQQELLSVEVPLPSKDKIRSFELTVGPFMHEIARNALENRRLALVRDALLPKLLNGELALDGL